MSAQPKPTIGRIVVYRSRTGSYDVPAVVNCTTATLNPEGVARGYVPPLSSDEHVHLTVFTPGQSGLRSEAPDFLVEPVHGRDENHGGTYREWDIAYDADGGPGTWRWPGRD